MERNPTVRKCTDMKESSSEDDFIYEYQTFQFWDLYTGERVIEWTEKEDRFLTHCFRL